jgi:UDP-D-galactose:(glucosyl)LPS alpha-1,6-D-galactosyltransferase
MMSGRGGTESAILGLARGLEALGDETRLYLLGGASTDARWFQQQQHTILGNSQQSRLRRFREYSFGLAEEFRRFRPDVVIALDGPRFLKGKAALTLSGSRAELWSWIHFPLERIAMRKVLRFADGHLATSEGLASQLRVLVGKRKKGTVVTIYNPIAAEVPKTARPAVGEAAVFLYVGRMEWDGQKRVNDLLAAAARLKGRFRLVMMGDGSDQPRLQQFGGELGIGSRVVWLGWQSDPWAAVKQASAMVLTSSFESFAIVLAEALARGVPCISSDCEYGPDEIVQEGISGWFYPAGDIEALAVRMQRVIDHPESLPAPDPLRASVQRFSAAAVAGRAHKAFAERAGRA